MLPYKAVVLKQNCLQLQEDCMVVVVAIMHAKNAIYLAEVNYAKSLREEKTVVN